MNKIFFTSDTHFNHGNIITYCSRPWNTIQEMNEAMIKSWNEVVSPEDTVYHLGDFAMGDRTKIPTLLSRLNGTLILIRGNHDHKKSLEFFENLFDRQVITINGCSVELVHNPSRAIGDADYVFCGHVHNAWTRKDGGDIIPADERADHKEKYGDFRVDRPFINVGVDVRGFRPRTFEELIVK